MRGGGQAVGVGKADRMSSAQSRGSHADRLSGPVDRYPQRGDCLACRSQPLRIGARRHQHLGEVDDAHQARGLLLPPIGEEVAGLGVVSIRTVKSADQDIGVEYELQRSSSSASSRSR